MAQNVTAQVTGGQAKVIEASTVKEALNKLGLVGNYTATVNGSPASMDQGLGDYSFVSFATAVKGGKPKTILRKK